MSRGNVSYVDKDTGMAKYQAQDDHDLYKSLQLAGSSFGIITEFHYRIYNVPDMKPVVALVYIENKVDLWRFEAAGLG